MRADHLDYFTLLRLAVGEMHDIERGRARRHVARCSRCLEGLEAMQLLDKLLKELGPTLLEPLSEQFAKRGQ